MQTVIFFGSRSNFLGKSDKNVKFGKSVRLGLESMKKGFGRNFCHSRASGDPLKQQQSQKNGVFSRFRLPVSENRPFLAKNVGARTLDLVLSKNVFLGLQHSCGPQKEVIKSEKYFFRFQPKLRLKSIFWIFRDFSDFSIFGSKPNFTSFFGIFSVTFQEKQLET